jgi:hypothetical protein
MHKMKTQGVYASFCFIIGFFNCNDHLQLQVNFLCLKCYQMNCINCTKHVVAYTWSQKIRNCTQFNCKTKCSSWKFWCHVKLVGIFFSMCSHGVYVDHMLGSIGRKKWTPYAVALMWIIIHKKYMDEMLRF